MLFSSLRPVPRALLGATWLAFFVLGCDSDDTEDSTAADAGETSSDAPSSETSPSTSESTESSPPDTTVEPTDSEGSETTVQPSPSDAGATEAPTSAEDAGGESSAPGTSEPSTSTEGDSDTTHEPPSEAGASTSEPPPEGDASTTDGTADDDAGGDDLSEVEPDALLGRTSTDAYACEVSTPATLLNVPSGFDSALAAVGGTVWYGRGESPDSGDPSLLISELGSDATLSNTETLHSVMPASYYSTQVLGTPDGLLIFSLRYGTSDTELTLAKATLEGERTRTAAPLEGLDGAQNYVVAMGDDNIALLFSKYSDDGPALYYLTLGFDGLPQGDPLLVQVSADSIVPGAIAATADGYMFSYVTGYQPSSLFVQTVDASGTLAERVPFADNENGLDDVHSLLVRGDEALLAWTDTGGTWNANDLDRTTILSRLDLGGNRIAQDVRVQSPVTNQERVEPKLSAHGDDVGLLWSEGSVIYICAGCMPDNQLQFVMLDGSTLSPASEVLTLTNPAVQGGLVAPEAVWQGDELSVVAAVGYHVNGEGAAATLTCSAQ